MKKKTTTALVVLALLAIPIVWAISTTTQVNFNIGSVVAYTLTLPGESAVSGSGGGAPTTAIEFNTSSGTDSNVDAKVVGGTAQSDGTPIFQFDNTGTVNLNLSVALDSASPSCVNFTGATTFAGADTGAEIGAANVTVANGYTPAAAAQDWYMKADFASCTAGDTTTRSLTSYGVQS